MQLRMAFVGGDGDLDSGWLRTRVVWLGLCNRAGMGLDASRIGGRSCMHFAATLPNGVGWWMLTQFIQDHTETQVQWQLAFRMVYYLTTSSSVL